MVHKYDGNTAFKHRSALKLMTMSNGKTPKGEKMGFLTAILYLMPHTSGGGESSLCPFSTEACRAMCLSGAGLSGLPKQIAAKQARTDLFNNDPNEFMALLAADVVRLINIAHDEKMRPAIRLNGTSDILWERQRIPGTSLTMMSFAPSVQFYDYTKVPLERRASALSNYHLTYSMDSAAHAERAWGYLETGKSIAIVTSEWQKHLLVGQEMADARLQRTFRFIDGDAHDLRFADPPSSIVLLRPKGTIVTDLLRPEPAQDLAVGRRMYQIRRQLAG